MIDILRVFHPVGQGAFYTEHFSNQFNVVYDCGTDFKLRGLSKIDAIIRETFRSYEEIDILFISHFHYDHISKIPLLVKSVKKIKRIVLPYLHDDEKILLRFFYESFGFSDLVSLIEAPGEYFNVPVTIILPYDNERDEEPGDTEPLDISGITNTVQLKSGVKLKSNQIKLDWVFLPYNFKNLEWVGYVKDALKQEGIDYEDIKRGNAKSLVRDKEKIREIYRKVIKDLNTGSLVVYSGLDKTSTPHRVRTFNYQCNCHCDVYCRYRYMPRLSLYFDCLYECSRRCRVLRDCFCSDTKKPSFIFTGDYNLNNKPGLRQIFQKYWDKIGCIQVPHHGSLKSFNEEIVDDCVFFPISHGNSNSYGHPSMRVVSGILKKRGIPVFVNESIGSAFIQCIRF